MKTVYHRFGGKCHFFFLLASVLVLITVRPASADNLWTDALGNGEWYSGPPANNWLGGGGVFSSGDSALIR